MAAVTTSVATESDMKLRELILYISETSEGDATYGNVKLDRLLFYSDFLAYRRFGKAITGQEYQIFESGPAPCALLALLNEMIAQDELRLRAGNDLGKSYRKPLALREAQLDGFRGEEIALVDRLIRRFWGISAEQMNELTDEFVAWSVMERGEVVPYSLALLARRSLTEQEQQWALELEPRAREILAQDAH
jgi:hypothetical protein